MVVDKVITLIHGTFAAESEWPKPGSDFQKELASHLSGEIVYEQFVWSGENSHEARFEGGMGLQEHVDRVAQDYPGAKQYLVTHSHGGNVALYAMRDARTAAQVDGVVAMAVPFVQAIRRNLNIPIFFLGIGVAILISIFFTEIFLKNIPGIKDYYVQPLVNTQEKIQNYANDELTPLLRVLLEFPAGLLPYLPLAILPMVYFLFPVRKHLINSQKRLFEKYISPPIPTSKILTINIKNDEVRWLLGSQAFLSESLHFLSRSTIHLLRIGFVAPILLYIAITYFWPQLCESGLFNENSRYSAFEELNAGLLLASAVASILIWVVFQPISLIIPMFARSHPLGMGWESFGTNWLVKLVPAWGPNTREERFLDLRFKAEEVPLKLRHNFMYYDTSFLSSVAEWIDTGTVTQDRRRIFAKERFYSPVKSRYEVMTIIFAAVVFLGIFVLVVNGHLDPFREWIEGLFISDVEPVVPQCTAKELS